MWNNFNLWRSGRGTYSAVDENETNQAGPFLASKEDMNTVLPPWYASHQLAWRSTAAARRELDWDSSYIHDSKVSSGLGKRAWMVTIANLLILGATMATVWQAKSQSCRCPVACAAATSDAVRATSFYSPVLKDMKTELHDIALNGTLFPAKESNWMRAEPSPELDAMWDTYETVNVFHITGEDVRALGGDPATAVKFPDEIFGLGDDAYMAGFDMLHKTHCLNELRKMAFENYHFDEATSSKLKRHGDLWWVHLRHCVDMLLQDQICHADADLIYWSWVDTQVKPWPEFGITRRCRSWDQIYQWGAERFVDLDTVMNFTKPAEGIYERPFERGYYEMFGFEHSTMFPGGEGYVW